MRKRMLRSVLAAAFSTVVAFGALSGLSDVENDVQQDTAWSSGAVDTAADDDAVLLPADTAWS
ncbi:hypothetical protein GCM10010297_38980 [Streptomyces malachitofuscus]|nr:hypothetical protein GCM10010297_38980 [Streptomyces malachitofuscus]